MSAHGPLTLHSAQTHPASLVAALSVSCAVKGATKSLLILDEEQQNDGEGTQAGGEREIAYVFVYPYTCL